MELFICPSSNLHTLLVFNELAITILCIVYIILLKLLKLMDKNKSMTWIIYSLTVINILLQLKYLSISIYLWISLIKGDSLKDFKSCWNFTNRDSDNKDC